MGRLVSRRGGSDEGSRRQESPYTSPWTRRPRIAVASALAVVAATVVSLAGQSQAAAPAAATCGDPGCIVTVDAKNLNSTPSDLNLDHFTFIVNDNNAKSPSDTLALNTQSHSPLVATGDQTDNHVTLPDGAEATSTPATSRPVRPSRCATSTSSSSGTDRTRTRRRPVISSGGATCCSSSTSSAHWCNPTSIGSRARSPGSCRSARRRASRCKGCGRRSRTSPPSMPTHSRTACRTLWPRDPGRGSPVRRPVALARGERRPPVPKARCRPASDRRRPPTHLRRGSRLRVGPLRSAVDLGSRC